MGARSMAFVGSVYPRSATLALKDAPRQNIWVLELGYHAGGCLGAVDDNVYMDETMTWIWFLLMRMDAGPRLGAVDVD